MNRKQQVWAGVSGILTWCRASEKRCRHGGHPHGGPPVNPAAPHNPAVPPRGSSLKNGERASDRLTSTGVCVAIPSSHTVVTPPSPSPADGGEQSVFPPQGGVVLSREKERSLDTHHDTYEPRKHYSRWKKPALLVVYVVCDSVHTKGPEGQVHRDSKSINGFLGLREKGLGNGSFSQRRAVSHMRRFWGLGHGCVSLGVTTQATAGGH